jgi:hypothetical protein
VLAYTGNAFAGDNAGVVLSLGEAAEISDVGAGQEVTVTINAVGMSAVKQFEWQISVEPAEAFDLEGLAGNTGAFSGVDGFFWI